MIATPTNGVTLKRDWDRKQAEKAKQKEEEPEEELSLEAQEQFKILRYCARKLTECQKARRPHETFDIAWALFNGDVWSAQRPSWRAAITINKIRAFITFIQAIMTDNKPRISVDPIVPGTEDAADLLRRLVDRDWDENNMQDLCSLWVLYGLIWGYAFIKVTYDPYGNGGLGKHEAAVIPPNRVYTNRTATCIEDAEVIVHVDSVSMGWVRRNYPAKANLVAKLRGITGTDRNYQDRERDYVREGTATKTRVESAMNINGNIVSPQAPQSYPFQNEETDDEVEIQEFWLRDETLESYERQVVKDNCGVFEPATNEDGELIMEQVSTKTIISEIDGMPTQVSVNAPKMRAVMETAWRLKYPNGRLVVIAGGRVLLRDIPNPYQTDGPPFAMWKDYDVGSFHGQGEPLALRSCAMAVNKLASQVFEILEKVGNPSYLMKKGAGVNSQSIKNKPGLIIPMDDIDGIKQLDKAQIPGEFFSLFKLVSDGMGEVSGVNEAVKGGLPAANTAFATMDQLQESGAAPIRLKVRNMERGLTRYGKLRIQLIQQYDQGARPLRMTKDSLPPGVVEPASSVALSFREYKNPDLQGQVEFGIVPISSLSTSPAGTWNRWMMMYDKHLIDRRWWHDKQRIEGYKTELPRMEKQEEQDAKLQAAAKEAGKPGPAPSKPARKAHRASPPTPSNVPSRADNAFVR